MKFKDAVILLGIVLLVACGDKQASTTVPLPVTSTPTMIPPSLTPTLLSTATPSPTFEIEVTIPAATLNAVATVDAMRIDMLNHFPELDNYGTFCSSSDCYGIEISPDNRWIYFTNANVIELFSSDGRKVGKYSFYDIYGYTIDYRDGYVEGSHWSEDGEYLYISANSGGDGGPGPYFGSKSALVRVNLEDGTWEDMGVSGSFEFSPNGESIIYNGNKSQVQVKRLATDQEQTYFAPNKNLYFGKYVWSPDNEKVVFVGTPEDWDADDSKFALLMVDIESQSILQLQEIPFPFYYPVKWTDADKIILSNFDNPWGEWTLDLSTNPPTISP